MPAAALLRAGKRRRLTVLPVVFHADAQDPWPDQWAEYTAVDASRFNRVADPAGGGGYALRVDLIDGDVPYATNWPYNATPGTSDGPYGERAEVAMSNPRRAKSATDPTEDPVFSSARIFTEGEDRWISWQCYLPTSFPTDIGTWAAILLTQFKQEGTLGTPVLAVGVDATTWKLMRSDSNGNTSGTLVMASWPLVKGRWARFTMHIKFSPDATVGFIEVWADLDGTGMNLLLARTYTYTQKTNASPATTHTRMGIYRDPAAAGNATAYFRGFTVAATRQAAELRAFRYRP